MSAVITVVIGAVLAGLFTLGGIVYGARREHAQWLRNTRLSAYQTFLTVTNTNMLALFDEEFTDSLRATMISAVSAVELAGPPLVAEAALDAYEAIASWVNKESGRSRDEEWAKAKAASDAFTRQARKALGGSR